MPKFSIDITERYSKEVVIEAKNREEAYLIAKEDYLNGKTPLEKKDFFDYRIEFNS
jgi:hypothetical protein